MILTTAIIRGFRAEIIEKMSGFSSPVQVTAFSSNISFKAEPMEIDAAFESKISALEGVKNIHPFAVKPGIIKTDSEVEGLVIKGVQAGYDFTWLKKHLLRGRIPNINDTAESGEIIISDRMARRLNLDTGMKAPVYFIQEPVRARVFMITGIYNTGFEDYDKTYAIGDLKTLQTLYGWGDNEAQGYEIQIHHLEEMDLIAEKIAELTPFEHQVQTIRDMKPQIFDWLGLLDKNVLIILTLMIIVACINIISALLIIITERGRMIAVLQVLGMQNSSIARIFSWYAAYLLGTGLFLGNVIGLGVGLLQSQYQIMRLDPHHYFMTYVPVRFVWSEVLFLNFLTFLICLLALIIPARSGTRYSAVTALHRK